MHAHSLHTNTCVHESTHGRTRTHAHTHACIQLTYTHILIANGPYRMLHLCRTVVQHTHTYYCKNISVKELLATCNCCSPAESLTLTPTTPRAPDLSAFTFLQCEIQPPDAMVDVGWRLPSGEFLTPNNDTSDIHISDVGTSTRADNTTEAVIILTITGLSYQHAGTYSCEARDTTTPGAEWITAKVDLQLRGTCTNHLRVHAIH